MLGKHWRHQSMIYQDFGLTFVLGGSKDSLLHQFHVLQFILGIERSDVFLSVESFLLRESSGLKIGKNSSRTFLQISSKSSIRHVKHNTQIIVANFFLTAVATAWVHNKSFA